MRGIAAHAQPPRFPHNGQLFHSALSVVNIFRQKDLFSAILGHFSAILGLKTPFSAPKTGHPDFHYEYRESRE
jgi:hypothetical protein